MDQDLKDYLDQHFASIGKRFERLEQRVDNVETEARAAHVVAESLRDVIQLVAEGVANVTEQMGRNQEDTSRKLAEIASFNRLSYEDLRRSQKRLKKPAPSKLGKKRPSPLA